MQQKIKLAVIGIGSVVREIYQHLYFSSEFSDFIEIVGIADTNADLVHEFGEKHGIDKACRFTDYSEMLGKIAEIDAVQVNTPDHLHCAPTLAAIERGCDVLIPKPTAATIGDAHRMISAAKANNRLLGIDFHKREDPRIKESAARYQSGRYGNFQTAVWYMMDKLYIVNPNHRPRFFATPDFAEKNTPISFLTVHMADAFMHIVRELPLTVRARGFKQKLPNLSPIPVDGYDLVDTEIIFANGGIAHIITGWHLPDTAHANTVQSSRLVCRDGIIDLALDAPGMHELTDEGIMEINPLFKNFSSDGSVSGYGISSPGKLLMKFLQNRNGTLPEKAKTAMMDNTELGFYTTAVLQAAENSLSQGSENTSGVIAGTEIDINSMLNSQLGSEAEDYTS